MAPALTEQPLSPTEKLSSSGVSAIAKPTTRSNGKLDLVGSIVATSSRSTYAAFNKEGSVRRQRSASLAISVSTSSLAATTPTVTLTTRVTRSKDLALKSQAAAVKVAPAEAANAAATIPTTKNLTEHGQYNNEQMGLSTALSSKTKANQKSHNHNEAAADSEEIALSSTTNANAIASANTDAKTINGSDSDSSSSSGGASKKNHNNSNSSTVDLLVHLKDDFEEAITAELCLRRQLLDVHLENRVNKTTAEDVVEPQDILVIKAGFGGGGGASSEASPQTHMESPATVAEEQQQQTEIQRPQRKQSHEGATIEEEEEETTKEEAEEQQQQTPGEVLEQLIELELHENKEQPAQEIELEAQSVENVENDCDYVETEVAIEVPAEEAPEEIEAATSITVETETSTILTEESADVAALAVDTEAPAELITVETATTAVETAATAAETATTADEIGSIEVETATTAVEVASTEVETVVDAVVEAEIASTSALLPIPTVAFEASEESETEKYDAASKPSLIISLQELPAISTDSTITASEVEDDNLEERLSQLDGGLQDGSLVAPATTSEEVASTVLNVAPATPPKTPISQQMQQLQLQLQRSPCTPPAAQQQMQLQAQQQQQQFQVTPQSIASGSSNINNLNSPQAFGNEKLSATAATAADFEDQDLEEVLKALKGFDTNSGAEALCDLNALFSEVYTTLNNYEDINAQAVATARTSPLKEAQAEIGKKQQSMQRHIEFLLRRMHKLQARLMCKQASEEVAGVFEWSARVASKGAVAVQQHSDLAPAAVATATLPRPNVLSWSEEEKKHPVSAMQLCTMMKRLETAADAQQLNMTPHATHSVATHNTNVMSTLKRTKKSQDALLAASGGPLQNLNERKGPTVVPAYDLSVAEEIGNVAGMLQTEMREVQNAMDSDATESSSGAESADEMVTYNNPSQQPLSIAKRAAWHYSRDRAAIASRWSWLLSQISDLDIKIRQHNELYTELRRVKGQIKCDYELSAVKSATSTTTLGTTANANATALSVNGYKGCSSVSGDSKDDSELAGALPGACRTRGFAATQFRKRKLFQTSNIHSFSKKVARQSTIKCGCQWPLTPCAVCTGRPDPTAPRDPPDTMMKSERVALLDPCYHSVLSFPEDVSSTLHFEAIARTSEWQQRVMRCQVKNIAKSVLKAGRDASGGGGHAVSRKYGGAGGDTTSTVKRRYIKKKNRAAETKKNAAAATSSPPVAAATASAALAATGTTTTSAVAASASAPDAGNEMAARSLRKPYCQLFSDTVASAASATPAAEESNLNRNNNNYKQQTSDYHTPNYERYNPSQAPSSLISNSNHSSSSGASSRYNNTYNNNNNNINNKQRKSSSSTVINSHYHQQQQSHQQQHSNNNNNNNNQHHHHQQQQHNNYQYYNNYNSSSTHQQSNGNSNNNSEMVYLHSGGAADSWDSLVVRSRTSSPTHGGSANNYHKYERSLSDRKNRSSYDIDNIVIPYSVAAATRVEILPYKEIPTPKWRVIEEEEEEDECNAENSPNSSDGNDDNSLSMKQEQTAAAEEVKVATTTALTTATAEAAERKHSISDCMTTAAVPPVTETAASVTFVEVKVENNVPEDANEDATKAVMIIKDEQELATITTDADAAAECKIMQHSVAEAEKEQGAATTASKLQSTETKAVLSDTKQLLTAITEPKVEKQEQKALALETQETSKLALLKTELTEEAKPHNELKRNNIMKEAVVATFETKCAAIAGLKQEAVQHDIPQEAATKVVETIVKAEVPNNILLNGPAPKKRRLESVAAEAQQQTATEEQQATGEEECAIKRPLSVLKQDCVFAMAVMLDEDISDDAMVLRHERALTEERRKFQTFLKFPWSTRSRANRRIDSRAESSGANTPDPASPAPQTPSVGGDQESIPSPLAPSTPLNPLDSMPEAGSGENVAAANVPSMSSAAAAPISAPPPAAASGVLNYLNNKRCERRRTTSAKKFSGEREQEQRRSPTPDSKELIPPYEPLQFPLTDEVFDNLQRAMPSEYHYHSEGHCTEECLASSTHMRFTRSRHSQLTSVSSGGGGGGGGVSSSRRPKRHTSSYHIVGSEDESSQTETVVGGGGGGGATSRPKQRTAYANGELSTAREEDYTYVADVEEEEFMDGDGDDDDDDNESDESDVYMADEDDEDDYPKHPLATDDRLYDEAQQYAASMLDVGGDSIGGGGGGGGGGAGGRNAHRSMLSDSETESTDAEPFQDDDPNDPEWRGDNRERTERMRRKF